LNSDKLTKERTKRYTPPYYELGGENMDRGQILCANCASTRRKRSCVKCGHDTVFIRIQWKNKLYSFWKDKYGNPYVLQTAYDTLREINTKIRDKAFNPADYTAEGQEKRIFQNAFKQWLQVKQKKVDEGQMSPETLRPYTSYYRNHFKSLYTFDVRDIKDGELEDLYDSLPSKLKSKSKKNIMKCLETFFNWCLRRRYVLELPVFPEIRVKDARKMRVIPYTLQINFILNLPEKHRDIYFFMRETAIRISEACVVMISDIDFPNKRALICRNVSKGKVQDTTKGGHAEYIPLSDTAIDIIKRNMGDRVGNTYIFINQDTQRRYSPETLRKIWRANSGSGVMLKEAMRHSTLTDYANQGASAFEIKELARHTDIRVSDRYVHMAKEGLYDLVNRNRIIKLSGKSQESQNEHNDIN